MLDEQRPLGELSWTIGTGPDLQLCLVSGQVSRISECVQASFLAVRADVRILAGVLLDLVLLQLQLSAELLLALGALIRQWVGMVSLEVSAHVALHGENLVAIGVHACDRRQLFDCLVGALFMALEVKLVCVLLRASLDVATEGFLKLQNIP